MYTAIGETRNITALSVFKLITWEIFTKGHFQQNFRSAKFNEIKIPQNALIWLLSFQKTILRNGNLKLSLYQSSR